MKTIKDKVSPEDGKPDVDQSISDSFPASDPVSSPTIGLGSPAGRRTTVPVAQREKEDETDMDEDEDEDLEDEDEDLEDEDLEEDDPADEDDDSELHLRFERQ